MCHTWVTYRRVVEYKIKNAVRIYKLLFLYIWIVSYHCMLCSELNGQLIERVATEFNRLQFHVSKVRGLPLVDELKPVIKCFSALLVYFLHENRVSLHSANCCFINRTYSSFVICNLTVFFTLETDFSAKKQVRVNETLYIIFHSCLNCWYADTVLAVTD